MSQRTTYTRIGEHYYDTTLIEEVWDEFNVMAMSWALGLDEPTKRDRLLYDILRDFKYLQKTPIKVLVPEG